MKKNKIMHLFLLSSSLIHAQSFVIKKSKAPSLRTLKESCCNQLADLIKEIPPVLRTIAQQDHIPTQLLSSLATLQEFACTELERYMEGSSQALFKQGSKKDLEALHHQLTDTRKILSNLGSPTYSQKVTASAQLEKNTLRLVSQQKASPKTNA